MERLLALILRLLTFTAFVAGWTWERSYSTLVVFAGAGIIMVAVSAILWLVRHPREAATGSARLRRLPFASGLHVEEAVEKFAGSLARTFSLRRFAAMLVLFLLLWLSAGLFHVLTLRALPIAIAPGATAAIALALLVVLPPTRPTMVGVYQTVAVGVLVALGLLGGDEATAYAVLVQLPQVLLWLFLGAWSYRRSNLNASKLAEQVRAVLQYEGTPEAESP